MAIIVVRLADQAPPGHPDHAHAQRRGDVIEVVPDGWQFSEAELSHPGWRVVRLPGLSVEEALGWAGGAYLHPDSGLTPPFRAVHVDLDHPDLAHLSGPDPGVLEVAGDADDFDRYKKARVATPCQERP